jgi:TonB family protein
MLSETVDQKRKQQEKTLKRLVTYSLVGSFVSHAVGLCFKVDSLWKPEQAEQEKITIVVTEPLEEDLVETIPSELQDAESSAESEFLALNGEAEQASAATVLEAPPVPTIPTGEPPARQEAESAITPISEAIEEPVTQASDAQESDDDELENLSADSSEAIAGATEPRDLSNLLAELRRVREQRRQSALSSNISTGQLSSFSSSGTSDLTENGFGNSRDTPTAVAPSRAGSGLGSDSDERPGSRLGEEHGSGESTDNPPGRGRRSREITCHRGCDDPDYPASANGAEGMVEITFVINAQGQSEPILSRSSGNTELDQAALRQAREQVRLRGTRPGDTVRLEFEFVQPGSEAAEQAQTRGNRRSITVSDPEPGAAETSETVPETGSPESASHRSPNPDPFSPNPPVAIPEPESSASSEPAPDRLETVDSEPTDNPDLAEPGTAPSSPSDTPSRPEPNPSAPAPEPALTPESASDSVIVPNSPSSIDPQVSE